MAPRMKIETNSDKTAPVRNTSKSGSQLPAASSKPKVTVQVKPEAADGPAASTEPEARVTPASLESHAESKPAPQQSSRKSILPTLVDSRAYDQAHDQGWDEGTAQDPEYYSQGQGQSYDQYSYDQPQEQQDQAQKHGSAAGQESKRDFGDVRRSMSSWVHQRFPGHEHAFLGGVIALVVALLVFIIGLPRMLLICLLVVVGVALGQIADGDPKIIRAIANLFNDDRDQQ